MLLTKFGSKLHRLQTSHQRWHLSVKVWSEPMAWEWKASYLFPIWAVKMLINFVPKRKDLSWQWCCGLKRAEFRSWPISSSLAPERSQQCFGGAVPSCALPSQIWSCLYKEEARSCCFPKEKNLWNSTKTAQILVGILERKQMMKLDDYFLQRIVNLIKGKVRENVERLGTTSIFGFEKSYLPSRYFLLLFFIVKISWKSQCFSSFYLIRNRK